MKKMLGINVYQAAWERIDFIFKNFERIYVSFSGGKDSGVMINLVLQYMLKNGITEKVGVMVMDNEANYEYSLKFMHSILEKNRELLDIYWVCLPITLPCTVSAYMTEWQCWGVDDEKKWVRPMPTQDYVINMNNHKFDFFRENMWYDEFWDKFGDWYGQGKTTACMIGIRTGESLNRWRAIMNERKGMMKGQMWTKKNTKYVYNCYPIYDWHTDDVWIANNLFDWEYNELYDIFWKAGLTPHQMRVASPFMSESKSSLNLYRTIDPHVWARLVSRVHGANFIATYGKQLTYHSFKLPDGHTWRSFCKFLIKTLPKESKKNFKQRFIQSIKFWWRVGRGLPERVIQELKFFNIPHRIGGFTRHGRKNKRLVMMLPPDHLDMLSAHNSDVTSWKRFTITILKNDHTCKYLGLAPTLEQARRQKEIQEKYKSL